jgi:hypothetical protein
MQQSGTHWLKNMLSGILVKTHGLPEMQHIQDDSIIGHTKSPPKYTHIPQIVHSHGFPHALTLRVPFLHYPRYLVLVRDLRSSLVSHYERFRGDYGDVDFAEYLCGDVRQKKFNSDIYSRIRFLNEWGRVIARRPGAVHVLKYEDMISDPAAALAGACAYFRFPRVTDDLIAHVVAGHSKDRMAARPTNPKVSTTVIRTGGPTVEDHFTAANEAVFLDICRRFLEHDFGYGYPARAV